VTWADQGAANPTFISAFNLANYPATDLLRTTPLWWKEVSATNRWKAFDGATNTQTSNADSITYKFTLGSSVDSIALLNMDAIDVHIIITDPVEGEVYNKTTYLATTVVTGESAVLDWWSYFFAEIVRRTDIVLFDLLRFPDAVIDVEINYSGGTAKCGILMMGMYTTIGETEYGPTIGIIDYSQKSVDSYGNYTIDVRDYAKRMNVPIRIQYASVSEIQRVMARYRSTPTVWAASTEIDALMVYGFYKDFSIVLPGPLFCTCALEIEGLI
jgi:hypothetical protein